MRWQASVTCGPPAAAEVVCGAAVCSPLGARVHVERLEGRAGEVVPGGGRRARLPAWCTVARGTCCAVRCGWWACILGCGRRCCGSAVQRSGDLALEGCLWHAAWREKDYMYTLMHVHAPTHMRARAESLACKVGLPGRQGRLPGGPAAAGRSQRCAWRLPWGLSCACLGLRLRSESQQNQKLPLRLQLFTRPHLERRQTCRCPPQSSLSAPA